MIAKYLLFFLGLLVLLIFVNWGSMTFAKLDIGFLNTTEVEKHWTTTSLLNVVSLKQKSPISAETGIYESNVLTFTRYYEKIRVVLLGNI